MKFSELVGLLEREGFRLIKEKGANSNVSCNLESRWSGTKIIQ